MRPRTLLPTLSAAAVVLFAVVPLAAAQQQQPVTGPLHVQVLHSKRYGDYLANGKGLALYVAVTPGKLGQVNQTGSKPVGSCTARCLKVWPIAKTVGAPVAGKGVKPGLLSTVKGQNGATQVRYAGWPLYYFTADTSKGNTFGQGVAPPAAAALGAAWFLIAPDGTVITKKPPQQ